MTGVATETATTVVAPVVLEGRVVRLEPLTAAHAGDLLAAASGPRDTYGLTWVPGSLADAAAYIDAALGEQTARRSLPFATVDRGRGQVVGSTRFLNIEYWTWPPGNAHQRGTRTSGAPSGPMRWRSARRGSRPMRSAPRSIPRRSC